VFKVVFLCLCLCLYSNDWTRKKMC